MTGSPPSSGGSIGGSFGAGSSTGARRSRSGGPTGGGSGCGSSTGLRRGVAPAVWALGVIVPERCAVPERLAVLPQALARREAASESPLVASSPTMVLLAKRGLLGWPELKVTVRALLLPVDARDLDQAISYRLRDAPRYLGMDRNRFNAEVRPFLTEIPIGRQSIAFDRPDLDR